jgi:hypothetical protein
MSATFSTAPPRGRLFVKGQAKIASSGRRKGVPNVATKAVKEMIACAAMKLGGVERLVEWARESELNERLFWSNLWPRLLPLTLQGSGAHGEIEMNVRFAGDELLKQLRERNLPEAVFGIDKPPMLELEPARIEADGSSSEGDNQGDVAGNVDVPMLEAIEEQICAPDSVSDGERAFLEARMQQHVGRYGGRS